ncbi:MAG: ATP-binding protein, partial [Bacteroidota bacterium]
NGFDASDKSQRTGALYFGLNRFHPDNIIDNPIPPTVQFTDLTINSTQSEVANRILPGLSYQNDLSFQYHEILNFAFVGLNHSNPQATTYQYRLLGFNDTWIDLDQRRDINLTNLSPGKYNLQVKAANEDGLWSEPKAFRFSILPPWYWAWWSKLLYLLLGAGAIYAFYRFQLSKRLAEQEAVRLQELDQVKNRLYTNITHEFRTPLTVIQGMAQRINGKYQKETQLIRKNSENLLHLVNQMLDLSKLEVGKLRLQIVQGDVIGFLRHEIEAFQPLATGKELQLHFQTDTSALLMDFDMQKLRQILTNLLSNAIKFSREGGVITVVARPSQDQLELTVKDNGIGIPANRLPYIFDRFYQVDDTATRTHEGTGIGLALTKELVELLQGEITVTSTEGEGTQFTIQLPIRNQAPLVEFSPEWEVLEIIAPSSTVANPIFNDPGLATALLIEDNEDIIQYLIYCLQDDYQILTALNGEEGISTAITHTPDVIICDVMMPKADGFEVTNTLKSDERTSHIPIILLTAKADQQSKVKGLDSGADAYLTKPFDRVELMIRLEKLVALRQTLQEKYASLDYFSPTKVIINPKEDVFLRKLKQQIEVHLEDANFGIEQLANAMNLSRSQLYRKTKALTGQSIAVFVRTLRLHHGRKLLRETDRSISEVAYRIGFNDPAYFSKTYAELFGYPPGQERN